MKNKNHVITRTNRAECGAICQNDRLSAGHIWQTRSHVYGEVKCQAEVRSDVVIPNELGNGETCQGLLRRFVHKIANNNEISPHNDMNNKIPNLVQDDNVVVAQNDVINKNVKNLFTYFPISLSLKKKVDSSPNALALNGYGFALMLKLVRLRITAFTLAEGATHVDLSPTKVKFAFTLAEVLITLGIIGIVAAMTIPNLMTKNIQKQTVVKLQKAISIMNQAYKMSFDDVGEANTNEAFEMGADKYFETYWAPYIKAAVLCNTYQQCGYKSNKPWVTASGAVAQVGLIGDTSGSRLPFYTADGTLYLIFVGVGTGNKVDGMPEVKANASILVDINGKDGPNKFGRDVFMLKRIPDGGGVQPFGYDLAESDVEANCKNAWFGNTCAEKIRRAGWKIDKSYPWK